MDEREIEFEADRAAAGIIAAVAEFAKMRTTDTAAIERLLPAYDAPVTLVSIVRVLTQLGLRMDISVRERAPGDENVVEVARETWELWLVDGDRTKVLAAFAYARPAIRRLADLPAAELDRVQLMRRWRGGARVYAKGKEALLELLDRDHRADELKASGALEPRPHRDSEDMSEEGRSAGPLARLRQRFGMSSEAVELFTSSPDTVSAALVFAGTRVNVSALFDHLRAGETLDGFLSQFPGVNREAAELVVAVRSLIDVDARSATGDLMGALMKIREELDQLDHIALDDPTMRQVAALLWAAGLVADVRIRARRPGDRHVLRVYNQPDR